MNINKLFQPNYHNCAENFCSRFLLIYGGCSTWELQMLLQIAELIFSREQLQIPINVQKQQTLVP